MSQDERMHVIDTQKVNLIGLNYDGKILDIGGGGEGIIGQIMKEKVVAIDPRGDELEEAAEGPLKIIMDARELMFLNDTFDIVTSFFTLMYIAREHHYKVFQEVHRVLKKDGEFTIWDVKIPKYQGGVKDIFLVPLEIEMKGKRITTTYGVSWKGTEQGVPYYSEIAEKAGFKITSKEEQGQIYRIKLKKG